MTDRVEIKIVGDESGAQAALRRTSAAVADAAAQMNSKFSEIKSKSREAFATMGRDAKDGARGVEGAVGGVGSALSGLKAHFASFLTGFKQGWNEADREIDKTRRSIAAAGNELGKAPKSGGALSSTMAVFKGGALLEGARQLISIGTGAVQTAAEFERLRSVLTTLTGSQAGGAMQFGELKKFATETPYQLTEVVTAFAKLKAQGLDPSNAALKSYGNTAAAMGKSLDQMVEAVADAAMGEYERLKEFGIKATDAGDHVVFNFKGQATSIAKNSADIQAYLQKVGNTDFAGAMDRQMDTLGGKFSNVADAAASFSDEIGQGGLSQALKDAADAMTMSAGSSEELAHGIGAVLGEAVRAVVDIIRTFGTMCGEVFATVKAIVGDAMGQSAANMMTLGNYIKTLESVIVVWASTVRAAFVIVLDVVRMGMIAFQTFHDVVVNALNFNFSGAISSLQAGVNAQVGIVRQGWSDINGIAAQGKARYDGIWSKGTTTAKSAALGMWDQAQGLIPQATTARSGGTPRASGGGGRRAGGARASGANDAAKAAREQIEADREALRERVAINRQEMDMDQEKARSEIELARLVLEDKLDAIDAALDAGTLTNKQAITQRADLNRQMALLDQQLEQKLYATKLKALTADQMAHKTGTAEYRNYGRQIEVLEKQHLNRMALLKGQANARQRQQDRILATEGNARMRGMANSWAQNLARMATLQQGFSATIKGLWDSVANVIAGVIEQILQKWIISQLVKIGLIKTELASTVSSEAAKAGAGGVASMAAAPFPVNLGAPAFGAAMASAAAAFGTIGFSAKSGYDVPALAGPGIDGRGGQLGVVHPREMILPEKYADIIRNGGGGGDVIHIHAMDARSFERFAKQNSQAFGKAVQQYVRQGGRG